MPRRGLGKGLAALIPEVEQEPTEGVVEVEVVRIVPNRYQPRKEFDEKGLEELAESIRAHGIVQPVVVRKVGEEFELVAGERRWRAAAKAGLERIPAIVRQLSDAELVEVALIENLQREDLNPIEEAEAYRRLADEFGLSQEEVARRVGKSRPQVANTLRLLELPERVREAVRRGELTRGHAKALLAVEDRELLERLADTVVSRGLSVRETEELVRRAPKVGANQGRRRSEEDVGESAWRREMESRLMERLGTRVRICGDLEQGKVEVYYFNREGLEEVLRMLGAEGEL
ncbi:MAG: ParB/RepB/Spo0J family partition protein [Bacillota bacterium]